MLLKGEYYGYWRIIGVSPKEIGDGHHKYYRCQCVCSSILHVREDDLKNGKSKSCGCSKSVYLKSFIGHRFNRWTVLSIGPIVNTHRLAKCKCECGYVADLRLSSVKNGNTKSCGCLRNERVSVSVKMGWKNGRYASLIKKGVECLEKKHQ